MSRQLDEAIRAAHAVGATDRQISESLGVTKRAVWNARRRMKLPCNRAFAVFSEDELERLKMLLDGGASIREAASLLGRDYHTTRYAADKLRASLADPSVVTTQEANAAFLAAMEAEYGHPDTYSAHCELRIPQARRAVMITDRREHRSGASSSAGWL